MWACTWDNLACAQQISSTQRRSILQSLYRLFVPVSNVSKFRELIIAGLKLIQHLFPCRGMVSMSSSISVAFQDITQLLALYCQNTSHAIVVSQ